MPNVQYSERPASRYSSVMQAVWMASLSICIFLAGTGEGFSQTSQGSPPKDRGSGEEAVSRELGKGESGKLAEGGSKAHSKIEVVVAPPRVPGGENNKEKKEAAKKPEGGFKLSPRKAVFIFLFAFFVVAFFFRRRILGYLVEERRPLPAIKPFDARPLGEEIATISRAPLDVTMQTPRSRFMPPQQSYPPPPIQRPINIINSPAQSAPQQAPTSSMPALTNEEEKIAFKRIKVRPRRPWE